MDSSSADATMSSAMVPLEYPKWEDWPIEPLGAVRYGHLVLLRIDTQASVAALGDEVASREAAILPQDWFLGVIMANGLHDAVHPDGSDSDMLNFRFTLVGAGLPEPTHASYPFAPAAQTAQNRPPLVTSSPLPWPDLHAHTYFCRSVVISSVHRSPFSLASRLDEDQLDALDSAAIGDICDRDTLPEDDQTAPVVDERSYDSSDFDELDDVELDEDMERKRGRVRLYVELSFDRAVCPGLPADPVRYDELTARVEDIWDDWEERMLREVAARRPRQTAEWVRSLADDRACEEPSLQGVDAPVQLQRDDDDAALEPPLDDDAILPEDAVDHRIERGYDARSVSDGSSLAFYYRSNLKFNISNPGQPATERSTQEHTIVHPEGVDTASQPSQNNSTRASSPCSNCAAPLKPPPLGNDAGLLVPDAQ